MTLVSGVVSQLNAEPPTGQDGEPRLMIDASVGYGRAAAACSTGRAAGWWG
jgi:hypothetical protein